MPVAAANQPRGTPAESIRGLLVMIDPPPLSNPPMGRRRTSTGPDDDTRRGPSAKPRGAAWPRHREGRSADRTATFDGRTSVSDRLHGCASYQVAPSPSTYPRFLRAHADCPVPARRTEKGRARMNGASTHVGRARGTIDLPVRKLRRQPPSTHRRSDDDEVDACVPWRRRLASGAVAATCAGVGAGHRSGPTAPSGSCPSTSALGASKNQYERPAGSAAPPTICPRPHASNASPGPMSWTAIPRITV